MILKNQLIIVTIVVLVLSIIIAYFISKKISKPITTLNESAKKLAKREYDVIFSTNDDYDEINELRDTLSYTRDELAKNDELRRDLMANVSHDLKTPLTMIKAYAEMVRDLTYKDKVKRNDNLNIIITETDRLNTLVNDILTLSKLESNIEELKLEDFDIVELIKTIVKHYKIFSLTEDYKFKINKTDEVIVTADKKKIEQVLYNLINNAINYTGKDKCVYINILDFSKKVRIEIIDTGNGISDENINKIWDKYYKTDKKHRRNTIGTGLGLSIVKNILKAHKFEYGVKSIKNKGTTFYFEIPKNK
jgi:signal transduction histidine kinase